MKHLILALVLILSNIAMASNWMPKSKILAESTQAFQLEETCKNVSAEECFDVGEYPSKVYSEVGIMGDDLNSPQYSKNDVESCLDSDDCQVRFIAKQCSNPSDSAIKNLDLLEVYCSRVTGYDQVESMVIQLDQVKLASYQSELTVLAQSQAMANAKASVKVLRECLAGVIDLLVLRNSTKNLTESQVEAMVATYSSIMDLLHAVSANTAKTKISEVVADGVLVTSSDKTALIAEINKCQGL